MDSPLDRVLHESRNQTLYERLGGKMGVYAVVDRMYDLLVADPALQPYFSTTDMDRLRQHQAAFLSFAFGGPAYAAPDVSHAHKGLSIQSEHFDLMIDHLVTVLLDLGIGDEEINGVVDRLYSFKQHVVGQ